MAITIQEMFDSRHWTYSKDREQGVLEFVGYGTDDDAESRTAFDAAIPAAFTFKTNPLTRLDFTHWTLGGKFWRATANYGPDAAPLYPAVGIVGPPTPVAAAPGPNDPLGPEYSFDFTGVTEKITQSKETTGRYLRDGDGTGTDAPDYKGAIGVTRDGVEGCERISPNLEWSRTVTFQSVTLAYIDVVKAMVGSTNHAAFYGKPARSQVFMGGNCQIDDTRRAKVTFKFLDRPNLTNVVICPGLTVSIKNGSEYLWCSYSPAVDRNKFVRQPDAAYVERVCDAVDFGLLGIGA
ncbi:hypothetical protein [Gemmata sp.]|uniref:hypothetical protein n=1 Tax=Gemmata sp. TaxID=1914242 RepID=UPI003F706258